MAYRRHGESADGKTGRQEAPENKQAEQAAAGGFAEGPQAAFEGEVYTSESTKHLIPALRNLKPSGAMPQPSHKLGKLPPIGDHPLLTGNDMPVFVPHRPPRPEKSEGGRPLSSSRISSRAAISQPRSASWSRRRARGSAIRCCSA